MKLYPKNCHFCNSENVASVTDGGDDNARQWVQCSNCLAHGPISDGWDNAVKNWNKISVVDDNSDYDRLVKRNDVLSEEYCLCKLDRDMWVACAMHAIRRLAKDRLDVFTVMKECMDFVTANKDKVIRT